MTHPRWTQKTLKAGLPRLRTVEELTGFRDMISVGAFMQDSVGGNLSWEYVQRIRDYWQGPILLKGIIHEEDAVKAVDYGFDGIVVSNHGARQFDGCLSSIEALPVIKAAVSDQIKIIFDSGVRSGLDILRAINLGADFVLCGRAYLYGVAALGDLGGYHTTQILREELINVMIQLGVETLDEVRELVPISR